MYIKKSDVENLNDLFLISWIIIFPFRKKEQKFGVSEIIIFQLDQI